MTLHMAHIAAIKSAQVSPIVRPSPSAYFLCMDLGVALGPMLMGALVPALGYRGMYAAATAVVALGLVYYAAVPGTQARRAAGTTTGPASPQR